MKRSACAPVTSAPVDLEAARALEDHQAWWSGAHRAVAGVEVHEDPELTWLVLPVSGWLNGGVRLRLAAGGSAKTLDRLLARFEQVGRGFGLWVSPFATPPDLEVRLRASDLRCRKRFPAMACDLRALSTAPKLPRGIRLSEVDLDAFGPDVSYPPAGGPITTERRRFEVERIRSLVATGAARLVGAFGRDVCVGVITVATNGEVAGIHDVAVLESHRGRGIGAALVHGAGNAALGAGARQAVLLSTGMGESVYRRVGFVEVARFAYWYRGER